MEQDRLGCTGSGSDVQHLPAQVTASETAREMATWAFDAFAWLGIGAAFAVACATFRDYGVPWDAQGESVYGSLLLRYYQSGFHDRSAFDFVNFRFYGGGFELPAALLARISPFGVYETRHLFCALLGLVGLAGTWRLARALGGARAAALAVWLLLTTPSWYGHIFINARDVPFASGVVWCLVFTLRALEELPRISLRTQLWFGLSLGLTLSVRVGGVLALLFLLVPIGAWFMTRMVAGVPSERLVRDAARVAGSLLGALSVAYVVMGALWPWALEAPLNPLRALRMFSAFPFQASVLFDGRLIPASALPASHLPVQLAVRLPEMLLVGIAGAALLGLLALYKRPQLLLQVDNLPMLAVVFAAAFPIVYSVLARPVDYNGMRHFLFVVPPLCVLAAIAFDRAVQAAPWRALRGVLVLTLAIAGIIQARAMVKLHPDEYVYFNSLVGGPRGAQGRFELDYWGVSLLEAAHRLADHLTRANDRPAPGQPPYKVYVCANVWSAATFFPSWLSAVDRIEDADFQIALTQHFCKSAPRGRRVLGVTRNAALLSYVDDLREPIEARRKTRGQPQRTEAPEPEHHQSGGSMPSGPVGSAGGKDRLRVPADGSHRAAQPSTCADSSSTSMPAA